MSIDNPVGGDRQAGRRQPDRVPARPDGDADTRADASPRPGAARQPAETRTMADLVRERHARPPIQPDKPVAAASPEDGASHRSGEARPSSGEHHHADRNAITHYHAQFKDRATDLYTDGARWASGDMVTQARQDNGHPARTQHSGDIPAGRDQGLNVIGDKPDRSPGDTSDLPPTGEQLLETENKDAPRLDQVRNLVDRDFGDFDDAAKHAVSSVQQALDRPGPTGHPGTVADSHSQWSHESPHLGTPDAGSIVELGLVLGVLGDRAVRWLRHEDSEPRGRSNGDH